ncbi:hypothetical protein L7F22_016117 [Adiantum nelumboides]|nr:hypothetical protein [Adiantum nelumboides]
MSPKVNFDDTDAPNYSKAIKNPMCFLRMREKIYTKQYTTWFSFVEDFEHICCNAMKYNQKRSQIWNAANMMLRKGRRCLEQQFAKHDVILGINVMHKDHNYQGEGAADCNLGPPDASMLPGKKLVEQSCDIADEDFLSTMKEMNDQNIINETSAISEVDMSMQKMLSASVTTSLTVDGSIDTARLLPEEDIRVLIDDQATECSSSFSGTQSEWEDNNFAVDSDLRDGNGANGANAATTENISVTSRRNKRALDKDWKLCKQSIEWQCRWIELQLQRLQGESNKYKRILDAGEMRKRHFRQTGSAARTLDMGVHTLRPRVLRRRQRRRAEEHLDSILHMSSHPIFARYAAEKQNQRNQGMSSAEKGVTEESWKKLEFDDFDFELETGYEDNIVLEKDSIEHYLWQIEGLQMKISDMKTRLIKSPLTLESASNLTSGLAASQNRPIRESKGQGGTSSLRRRKSDFDINNVIMPDSLMANYVQPARHAFIETPHWRVVVESAAQAEVMSSEEDTDDEVYQARHAHMQAQERQHQYSPLVLNKSRNLSTTKERPKRDITRRGSFANAVSHKDLQPAFPTLFQNIPKKKRRKRER